MQEKLSKEVQEREALKARKVVLIIGADMVTLSGHWNWELYSDVIYASDVMQAFPSEYIGTKGIIHPDDLPHLRELIFSLQIPKQASVDFRIITSFGQVVPVSGRGIEVESNEVLDTGSALLNKDLRLLELEKENEKLHLEIRLAAHAERVLDTAHWLMNTTDHFIYYSDQFYRIHGIPPQSLNAHLHTFLHFVHPDDREVYSEAIERSFRQQLPLHLSYRIVTFDRKEKHLQLITHWQFSSNGTLYWSGILEDLSEEKEIITEKESMATELELLRHTVRLWEKGSGVGYWHYNTLTRKVIFSEGCYRLHGIKKKLAPTGLDAFIQQVHPEDRGMVHEACLQLRQEHTMSELEYRVLRNDGKTRYIRQEAQAVVLQDEVLLVGTMQDVTVARMMRKKITELDNRISLQEYLLSQTGEAGMGSWVWDLETGEHVFHSGFQKELGFPPNNTMFTLKQLSRYIHVEDRKSFQEQLDQVLLHKAVSAITFRMVCVGTIRNVRGWFGIKQLDDREFLVALLQDITGQQESMKKMGERAQMAEAVIENMRDSALLTDVHNQVMMWNRQCELKFRVSRDDVIGKNLFDVFPRLRNETTLLNLQAALNGKEVHIEKFYSEITGGLHALHLVPLKNEAGDVWGVVHLLHDITREHQLQEHLGERLNYIESIVESAVDRIIVLDRNMNYKVWNHQCERFYGIPREEVIGKNILEVFPDSINEPGYLYFKKALRGETIYLPAGSGQGADADYFDTYLIPVKNDIGEVTSVLWMVHDLREIMEARYRLEEEHRMLNEAQAAGHVGSFAYDTKNDTVHYSDELYRLLGYEPGDITPSLGAIMDTVHPDDRARLQNLLQEALSGKPFRQTWKITLPAGHTRYISGKCQLHDTKLVGILQDVTEVHLAEAAAALNRDMLLQTAQASPDSITIYDLEKKQPFYINDCLANWLGYTSQELIDMGVEGRSQLFLPGDLERIQAFNDAMKAEVDGNIRVIEYGLLTRDGKPFQVRNRSRVFRRNGEGAVTHILSILQDINEETAMRNTLVKRTRFLETVLDANTDRIIVMDRNLGILAWNRRCEEVYGFKKEDVLHKSFIEIFPALANEKELLDALEKVNGGEPVQFTFRKDVYSNGYSQVFMLPLKDETGNTYAILNLLHDITQLYEAQQQLDVLNNTLESKNRELAQKNEEITSFAFVASHDLKEPLRKLQTFSDWLLQEEEEKLSSNGKAFLRKIANSVRRLDRLIDDILLLTRIHSDVAAGKDVDLNAVLLRVIAELNDSIAQSGAEINMDQLPVLQGNDNQLFYLFKNLVDNALRFRDMNIGPVIRITASRVPSGEVPGAVRREGDFYCISVTDNGPGIERGYHKKIFQVFQRLGQQTHDGGTGMGLAICTKIMQNHNGFISVNSTPGKGSTFSCYFPVS